MKKIKGKITRSFLCFLSWISPKWNYSYRYRRIFGRKINLENPKTFNEKILWLELHRYHNDPIVIQCCDKNLVREYVDRCGCGDALVPVSYTHLDVYKRQIVSCVHKGIA